MAFQDDPSSIAWRLHLRSSPEVVYWFLSTDEGRSRFWAESTVETDGEILFQFPYGVDLRNHDPQRTWASGYADN